jgi:hypothetical protein
MASLLFCLLLLPAPAAQAAAPPPVPLLADIGLDAAALRAEPALLAADTLALAIECRREAFYKLSERDAVLAAGRLLPGRNGLRVSRPGLFRRSQSLLFVLETLDSGATARKFLRLRVTVDGRPEEEPSGAAISGAFRLEMFHGGRLIGFRQKRMQELVTLTTGGVAAPADPLRGASLRGTPPPGQSVSIVGLGMALAKYLAQKKAGREAKEQAGEMEKRRLSTTIVRRQADGSERAVPVEIELRTE